MQLKQTLAKLISIPSISATTAEWDQSNQKLIDQLETWLTPLGFQCEIQTVDADKGKYNLIATLGKGEGGLVLAGHSDTVPYDQNKWQFDPFKLTEADGKLYGLGICDMKSFFAFIIEAVQPFLNKPLKAPIILLATADEETSMAGAKALTEKQLGKPRFAVIGEPTGLKPVRMHKGFQSAAIRITGQSGHSSNPALGNNAIDIMHQVLTALITFRQELQKKYSNDAFEIPYPTMNFGYIHGGDNPNRICGHCQLHIDFRAIPQMPLEEVWFELEKRLQAIQEKTHSFIQLERMNDGAPGFITEANSELISLVEKLTNSEAEIVNYATEAPFLNQLGAQTVVLGPGNIAQAHQPDEWLDSKKIEPTVKLLQNLIQHFCC